MKMPLLKTLRWIFPTAALLLLAVPLFAQNEARPITTVTTAGTVHFITGTVRMPDGSPAVGTQVQVITGGGAKVETDAQGRFDLQYRPQLVIRGQGTSQLLGTPCLLVRDEARNLAVAQDLDEGRDAYDLKLAPALTLAGRVECDGKLLTNQVSVRLLFWTGQSGPFLKDLARTNVPGQYEIPALPPGRRYGLVISAPGYGQSQNLNLVLSGEPGRQELDPVELRPANLKLAGQVLDKEEKPVADCEVSISGEGQLNANARTDHEGRFVFDQACAGPVRVTASQLETYGLVIAEGGDTNVVVHLNKQYRTAPTEAQARKLQGIVRDATGQPVAGAQVAVFPAESGEVHWFQTDTNGSYHLTWFKPSWQRENTVWVVARDLAREQAVKVEWLEEATNLDVALQPALTLAGQVKNAAGAPLSSARMRLWIRMGNGLVFLDDSSREKPVNAEGRFEIKNLPPDAQYALTAMANNYGSHRRDLNPDGETRLELETFVLNPADQIIAGQVLDAAGKPVPGANVRLGGNDQPEGYLEAGNQGRFRFKVCQGQVNLMVNSQNSQNGGFAQAYAEVTAGDTNIVINLIPSGGSRPVPIRFALKDSPLPDLTTVHLTAANAPVGQPVVLCLFDANQRPSRHALQVLNQQAAALRAKNITVLAVQVSVLSDAAFNEWKTASGVTFPVGRVTETTDKTKWATRINALPWLVLADAKHVVTAEGFSLDDLPAQLDKLVK